MAIERLKKSCGHRSQKCCGAFLPVYPALVQTWSRDRNRLMLSSLCSFEYDTGDQGKGQKILTRLAFIPKLLE